MNEERLSDTKLAKTVMVLGTSSDVGKSIVATALCRIFAEDGLRVAPFKAQNMSNNAFVTADGKEIGRAQGVQADACRIAATTDMNPILLKPKGDMTSQVVVHGVPLADYDARAYRESYLPKAAGIVQEALRRLRASYDAVVMEGAGSPAEINLKDRDIVNMKAAEWGDAPAVLVADIDRGGVFAMIVGTLELLEPEERARIGGFIINKFRGDVELLRPGLTWLEERTGKPVLGVIPYLPMLGIEDEDSASLDSKRTASRIRVGGSGDEGEREAENGVLDIAVIRFPRIANFTDLDPLEHEQDVRLRYVSHAAEWGRPDAVILPGSKNTVLDLAFLEQSGLRDKLLSFAEQGGFVAGICGGYQMLGRTLLDPETIESDVPACDGLGLLPTVTRFERTKRTVRVEGTATAFGQRGIPIDGYEIHMGRTELLEPAERPFRTRESGSAVPGDAGDPELGVPEGASLFDGRVWGTYIHGILHNDDFRRAYLNKLRTAKGWPALPAELRFKERREAAFDRLAAHVRSHLDMKRIYEMIGVNGNESNGGDPR